MNRWATSTRHSVSSTIQLSACCWLTKAGCNEGTFVVSYTSLGDFCRTGMHVHVNLANVPAGLHFTKAACVFKPHAYFLNSTRDSRHWSGCLCCVQVRGDKIIVFSDNIFSLRNYAVVLKKPFIYGGTSHAERTRVLHAFKHNPQVSYPSAPSSPLHRISAHTSPQCRNAFSLTLGIYDCAFSL
jgi:hypothetical protein